MSNRPDLFCNYVLSVITVRRVGDQVEYRGLAGTAFLIKDTNGLAMTACHVADSLVIGEAAVLFVDGAGAWQSAEVRGIEKHPTQDVALLRLEPGDYPSPLALSRAEEHATMPYSLWGYPEAVLYEVVVEGLVRPRPSLVYDEGYIRRRITWDLPGMRGTRFFELSTISGAGCSGAPVVCRRSWDVPRDAEGSWQVVGVYIGERRSNRGDIAVGYAVRLADIDFDAPGWSVLFNPTG